MNAPPTFESFLLYEGEKKYIKILLVNFNLKMFLFLEL